MKSAPPETAELLHRVRQQLILAQVRIMELEDERDELLPRLAENSRLLEAAQALADRKMDEAAHLAKVQADLQAQYEHMRHMQHVTNEALNAERRVLAETTTRLTAAIHGLAAAEQRADELQKETGKLGDLAARLDDRLNRLGQELAESGHTAASRLRRIDELVAEIQAMKATRVWRWTSWLRSVERWFSRR